MLPRWGGWDKIQRMVHASQSGSHPGGVESSLYERRRASRSLLRRCRPCVTLADCTHGACSQSNQIRQSWSPITNQKDWSQSQNPELVSSVTDSWVLTRSRNRTQRLTWDVGRKKGDHAPAAFSCRSKVIGHHWHVMTAFAFDIVQG